MSLQNRPTTLYMAVRDGHLDGFACYDATARGMVGPIGVRSSVRKGGVGASLLRAALEDMHAAGYAYAVAGDVGAEGFFSSVAGAMALLGMELNFMNVAVLPIVVGVSIDNAVHIYHRYLEEGPASIPLVLRHTVAATTLSSATNLMGFGAMIVAHHGGLRSVAELAILGVGLTFFSTSVFFPLALEWWGERRTART